MKHKRTSVIPTTPIKSHPIRIRAAPTKGQSKRRHRLEGVKWSSLIEQIIQRITSSGKQHGVVSAIAREHFIARSTLDDKWKQWQAAVAVTPTLRVSDAGLDDDHRGECHRVFTPDQEQNIMERINARMAIDKRGLSDNDIANIARIYHRELHGPPLRSPYGFTASHGWVTDFKRRYGYSSGPPHISTTGEPPEPDLVEAFISECRTHLARVGRANFFNVDETKWKFGQPPRIVLHRGSA
jgi:transposase-like protein